VKTIQCIQIIILLTTLLGCGGTSGGDESSTSPGVTYPSSLDLFKLTSPADGSVIFKEHKFVVSIGEQINLKVARVEYWADKRSIHLGTSNQAPFSFDVDKKSMGSSLTNHT